MPNALSVQSAVLVGTGVLYGCLKKKQLLAPGGLSSGFSSKFLPLCLILLLLLLFWQGDKLNISPSW